MGPKIAVIGSCQVVGISEALKRLVRDADVSFWHVGVYPTHTKAELAEILTGYDMVISQLSPHLGEGILNPEILAEKHRNFLFFPPFAFRGFQPDCIYLVNHTTGEMLNGPYGHFHSSIAAASHVLGLSPERTAKLYNAFLFSKLGFFDAFPAAMQNLEETYNKAGFNLGTNAVEWLKTGESFTYLPNHPKIHVLASLAGCAARLSGFDLVEVPEMEHMNDMLHDNMHFPVFPELARKTGVKGGTTFIRPLLMADEDGNRSDSLELFIKKSYALYDTLNRDHLRAALPAEIMTGVEEFILDKS